MRGQGTQNSSVTAATTRTARNQTSLNSNSKHNIFEAKGADSGIWFHVSPVENSNNIKQQGLKPVEGKGARWVDGRAVYLWPSYNEAQKWIKYNQDTRNIQYDIYAVKSNLETGNFSPDNEHFSFCLDSWYNEHYGGEPWPQQNEDYPESDFDKSLLDISDSNMTVREWLENNAESYLWEAEDEGSGYLDFRVAAQEILYNMPSSLRKALVKHYSDHDKPVMTYDSVSPQQTKKVSH